MYKKVPIKNYLLLAIPFLIIFIATGLDFKMIWDEGLHIAGIYQFRDSTFSNFDLRMYPSSTTPLFQIILGLLTKIVGSEFWKLRLINLLIGFFSVIIFYRIARNLKNQYPFLNTVLFLFFPYFLILSSLVMTDILALFFGLLALMFYIENDSTRNMFIGSFFSILAVLTRQFYLFLPAGMIVYYVLTYKNNYQKLKEIFIFLIPIISFLPFVLYWGGMAPPALKENDFYVATDFNQLNQIGYFLLFLGFYFFPYVLVVSLSFKKKFEFIYLTLPIIFILLYNIFNKCNGITCQVLHFSNYLYPFLLFILLFFALTIIITYLSKNEFNLKLLLFILSYLGVIILTPYISERYLMVFVPFLILALFNKIERRIWVYYMWIVIMIIFSIIYFISKIY